MQNVFSFLIVILCCTIGFGQTIYAKSSGPIQKISTSGGEWKIVKETKTSPIFVINIQEKTLTENHSISKIDEIQLLEEDLYTIKITTPDEMKVECLLDLKNKNITFEFPVDEETQMKMEYHISELEIKN